MRKILSLVITSLMVVLYIVPVFATDLTEYYENWTIDPALIDQPSLEETIEDSVSESEVGLGETISEPVSEDETEVEETGSEVPTVNISDESIQAIADAVASSNDDVVLYDTGVLIEGATKTISFPDEWLTNYPYISVWGYSGTNIYYVLSDVPLMYDAGSGLYGSAGNDVYVDVCSYNTERDPSEMPHSNYLRFDVVAKSYVGSYAFACYWSNFDVYDEYGYVFHGNDLYVPVISFDTGFEDLTFEPQLADILDPPTPNYTGWIFLGWYLDSDFETQYTPDVEFAGDSTLYAKWEEVPPMAVVSQNIFGSLEVFLKSEPIFYILSLLGLVLVIATIKTLVTTRA